MLYNVKIEASSLPELKTKLTNLLDATSTLENPNGELASPPTHRQATKESVHNGSGRKSGNHYSRWTVADDKLLLDNYPQRKITTVASLLHRSPGSVYSRIWILRQAGQVSVYRTRPASKVKEAAI